MHSISDVLQTHRLDNKVLFRICFSEVRIFDPGGILEADPDPGGSLKADPDLDGTYFRTVSGSRWFFRIGSGFRRFLEVDPDPRCL